MAGTPPPLDAAAAFRAVTDIIDDLTTGPADPMPLRRVLTSAQRLVGGTGAGFVLSEPGAVRVIAATGAAAWLEGRRVRLSGSPFGEMFGGTDRTIEFGWDAVNPSLAPDLHRHGLIWVMMTKVVRRAGPLGALCVALGAPRDGDHEFERAVLECLAAGAGALALVRPDQLPDPLAAVPEGLAVVDPDGRIRAWNPAAEQILGDDGTGLLYLPLPFPVPEPGEVAENRIGGGRWVEARCAVLDAERRVVTFHDVTEHHRQDSAQELFLATAGHELRTPLTIVRGYAETLATRWDDLDEPGRRGIAEVILTRSRELTTLVDRLLDGGRDSADAHPFALGPVLTSALATVPISEGGHTLVVDVPAALPPVIGDPASIPTIVTELLTNAYKYSPDGGDVEVTAGVDPGTVWLRVADRGVGVPPEHAEAVFARFWQADRGDQRRFGGVGLGLYIIRRLLDRQGGWVSLRPRPGGGSVVEVRLRRAEGTP